MASSNIGQVAGIYVGTNPPENIKLIWWDSTPSQQVHKVYDYNLKQWVIINQSILSSITYSELKNIANTVGLSLGKFYVLRDKSDALAISIATTKIQYVDVNGNLLVDDLAANASYFISSSNLTMDGVTGVFNSETTRLDFPFTEVPTDEINFTESYLFGKAPLPDTSPNLGLFKIHLSSLLSKETGNSLIWNKGLYFNYLSALSGIGDKKGGLVLYDTYLKDKEIQDQSIENIANNYSTLYEIVMKAIAEGTSSSVILKVLVPALAVSGAPIDPRANDTLYTVLSKMQRWINSFKTATGIKLSKEFAAIKSTVPVNNNDTVEVAIAKLQNSLKGVRLSLPTDWTPAEETHENILPGDGYDSAFSKIEADRRIMNGLETPHALITLTALGYPNTDSKTVDMNIWNGMLEINLTGYTQVQWGYGSIIEYDYTRFFPFNFEKPEIFNMIKDYLYMHYGAGPDGDVTVSNARPLTPLTTVKIYSTYNNETSAWESPTIVYEFQLYFGYGMTYNTSGVEELAMGLVLKPLTVFSLSTDRGTEGFTYISDTTTIYSLLGEGKSSARYRLTIPPMLIRYKLW